MAEAVEFDDSCSSARLPCAGWLRVADTVSASSAMQPTLRCAHALRALTGRRDVQVAACVCLFSLDKACAIPVDTHVWQLACRYYAPHLRNKTLNKQVHQH